MSRTSSRSRITRRRRPKALRPLNELQPIDGRRRVAPIPGRSALRRRNQSVALIRAHRIHTDTGRRSRPHGQSPDGIPTLCVSGGASHAVTLNLGVWSKVKTTPLDASTARCWPATQHPFETSGSRPRSRRCTAASGPGRPRHHHRQLASRSRHGAEITDPERPIPVAGRRQRPPQNHERRHAEGQTPTDAAAMQSFVRSSGTWQPLRLHMPPLRHAWPCRR